MDIEGAKSIKAETETTIRDLLIDFSTKTGLVVNGVDFEMTETIGFTGERKYICTSVKLDVRLGILNGSYPHP